LTLPAPDEPVVVVGAPLTGAADTSFLRLAACPLESRANLVIEFVWHWFDYARNRCADIAPGSSGSAVISRRTGRLLGLMNTTTIGAAPDSDCFIDHPCGPVPGDVARRPDTSYLTPLVRVDRCFDRSGRFDVAGAGCPLDPGLQVVLTPATLGGQNPRREPGLLRPLRQRRDVTVSGPFDHHRYKVADAATGDCRDLRGYGTPRRAGEYPVIEDPLPLAEGYQFLCVIGGTGPRPSDRWQSLDHPTVVAVRIDTVPPRIPARITVRENDLSWIVEFGTIEPEIVGYAFKFGRPSGPCLRANRSGYTRRNSSRCCSTSRKRGDSRARLGCRPDR
jgi:hypothetical protein